MTTKKRKICRYCNPGPARWHGDDFGDGDGYFQLRRISFGYCINAWRGEGGKDYAAESDLIHYCPMCGRKLKED